MFINIYGIDKKVQSQFKFPTYVIFLLKVVDTEKDNLIFVTDEINAHCINISNFSRLVHSQKTQHNGHAHFCKRCFVAFDN